MPYYFPLKHNLAHEERQNAAARLLALRDQIRQEIPRRTIQDTLLLATWNIRDFDSNKYKHGPRLAESFFYIAEIISAFDLVALQEVNEDMRALKIIMRLLGPSWDFIATDKAEGSGGNQERMVFVYDKTKVQFQNIAGEILLPATGWMQQGRQFARTPFLVSFQAGWFRFMICTVHIYYGEDRGELLARRIEEIDNIARFLARRADSESANYILLGDFNIISPEHQTMTALQRHGFHLPLLLTQLPSNMDRNKHYDQIAFKAREGQVQFAGQAGVFNYYDSVFRAEDCGVYLLRMQNRANLELTNQGQAEETPRNLAYYHNTWRTYQMSDHLPMWVALNIDFAGQYLQELLMPSFTVGAEHPLDFSLPELEGHS